MFLNYYDILGVAATANTEDIKKAFRIKAKLFHPDVNSSPDAPEKFRLVNQAYEVLIDTQKRYLFDLQLDSLASRQKKAPPRKRPANTYTYSSAKADPNFHYDWSSISRAAHSPKSSKPVNNFAYYFLFVFGIFMGFVVIAITLWNVYQTNWKFGGLFAAIPGIFMIREGWKGLKGKQSWLGRIVQQKLEKKR